MTNKTQKKMLFLLLLGLCLGCTENDDAQAMESKPFFCMPWHEESGITINELQELYNYTGEDILNIAEGERVGRCSGELVESGDFTVSVQFLGDETNYAIALPFENGYQVTEADRLSCAVASVPVEIVVQSSIEELSLTFGSIMVLGTELLDDWGDNSSMDNLPGGVPLIGKEFNASSGMEVEYYFALPPDGTLWLYIANDGSEIQFQQCDFVNADASSS